MIPRFVGKKSSSTATTPTFTSAIAEECKKISTAYQNQAASSPASGGDIIDLGEEETNALIDKIMQGSEEGSGDIIDLDFLLSGVPDTQSEPSATPARYSFALSWKCAFQCCSWISVYLHVFSLVVEHRNFDFTALGFLSFKLVILLIIGLVICMRWLKKSGWWN